MQLGLPLLNLVTFRVLAVAELTTYQPPAAVAIVEGAEAETKKKSLG